MFEIKAVLLFWLILPGVLAHGPNELRLSDFAADEREMPYAYTLAKHYMDHRATPFTSGDWKVAFAERYRIEGDAPTVLYDVTIRATKPRRALYAVYHYVLRAEYGSTACYTLMWTTGGKTTQTPPAEETARLRDAGECPDFRLTVWQTRIGEGKRALAFEDGPRLFGQPATLWSPAPETAGRFRISGSTLAWSGPLVTHSNAFVITTAPKGPVWQFPNGPEGPYSKVTVSGTNEVVSDIEVCVEMRAAFTLVRESGETVFTKGDLVTRCVDGATIFREGRLKHR